MPYLGLQVHPPYELFESIVEVSTLSRQSPGYRSNIVCQLNGLSWYVAWPESMAIPSSLFELQSILPRPVAEVTNEVSMEFFKAWLGTIPADAVAHFAYMYDDPDLFFDLFRQPRGWLPDEHGVFHLDPPFDPLTIDQAFDVLQGESGMSLLWFTNQITDALAAAAIGGHDGESMILGSRSWGRADSSGSSETS